MMINVFNVSNVKLSLLEDTCEIGLKKKKKNTLPKGRHLFHLLFCSSSYSLIDNFIQGIVRNIGIILKSEIALVRQRPSLKHAIRKNLNAKLLVQGTIQFLQPKYFIIFISWLYTGTRSFYIWNGIRKKMLKGVDICYLQVIKKFKFVFQST